MVIISNGFSKFHLAVAAAEANRRGQLTSFVTGAYPTPLIDKILQISHLRTMPKIQRLRARYEEIEKDLVHALFTPEALCYLGEKRKNEIDVVAAYRFYGWLAGRYVRDAAARGAQIYHYRAGFGGASVKVAKELGMFALCDHSIAHPTALDALVGNMGKMPAIIESANLGTFWTYVLGDLLQADSILVNSHFVEDTFRRARFTSSPVQVVYLGVDDSFLDLVQPRARQSGELSLLFAGSFEKRKGAEVLIAALKRLDNIPWKLEVAGNLDPGLTSRHRDFFTDSRVKYLGLLSRKDLARVMSRAEVFVFPSLAEGSARVVFEALACGCYVITTPNSGSIVEDGIHGSIVPPGSSASLAEAIVYALEHRDLISNIGANNSNCVKNKHRQFDYGEQLSRLYRNSLTNS